MNRDEILTELFEQFKKGGLETKGTKAFLDKMKSGEDSPDKPPAEASDETEAPEVIDETSDSSSEKIPLTLSEVYKDMEKAPIFCESGKGREKNLEGSLGEFLQQTPEVLSNIEGQKVLIKVNAVDPEFPNSCITKEAVIQVIKSLLKYKPAEIMVGDLPANMFMESRDGVQKTETELLDIFKKELGYDFSSLETEDTKISLLDIRTLPQVTEKGPDETELQMYDTSGFGQLIILSQPKSHGQMTFSCSRKNVMGLMPKEQRASLFHPKGEDWGPKNLPGMIRLSETFTKNHPGTIYIVDGFTTLVGHEHRGFPIETDYAIVSKDPYNADVLSAKRSFSPDIIEQAPYLTNIPIEQNEEKTKGELGPNADIKVGDKRLIVEEISEDGGIMILPSILSPALERISNDLYLEVSKLNLEDLSQEDENKLLEIISTLGNIGDDKSIKTLYYIWRRVISPTIKNEALYRFIFPYSSSRHIDLKSSEDMEIVLKKINEEFFPVVK